MMNWNDYREEVKNDAISYLEENREYFKDMEWYEVEDHLMMEDAVTGNASGSYTFSTYKAKENIADIIWDEEVIGRFYAFGYDGIPLEKGPEAIDVIARVIAFYEVSYDIEEACFDMYWK